MTFQCDSFTVKIQDDGNTYFVTYSGNIPKEIVKKIQLLNYQKPPKNTAEMILKQELKKHLLYTR